MPATPVPAATIILLRDAKLSPEVLLVQRSPRSEFLPDLYVFPGGRVDDTDHDLVARLGRIDAAEAGRRAPSVAQEMVGAYFVAAIRETFEEAGILLARRRGKDAIVGRDVVERMLPQRLAVQSHDASFRDLVDAEDLELAGDLLAAHGHWITPELAPHRYDTLFMTARAPSDQLAAHDGVESTDHVWIRPEEALEQASRGERQIIFPTLCNLETVAGFANADAALAASHARPVVAVTPQIINRGGKRRLVIPTEAAYPTNEAPVPSA